MKEKDVSSKPKIGEGEYQADLIELIGSLETKRADEISKNILDLIFSDVYDDPCVGDPVDKNK